jgi:hypothetical protein
MQTVGRNSTTGNLKDKRTLLESRLTRPSLRVTGWVGFAWNMENSLRNTRLTPVDHLESLHFSEDHYS